MHVLQAGDNHSTGLVHLERVGGMLHVWVGPLGVHLGLPAGHGLSGLGFDWRR